MKVFVYLKNTPLSAFRARLFITAMVHKGELLKPYKALKKIRNYAASSINLEE